ncbi:HNH endonuclease signature motif containing protein [Nakamurella flava]
MPFKTKAIRNRARRRIAQRVRAGEPCCLCGQPIDLSIAYPDPWSFTVEHTTPTSRGGTDDYEGLAPAHNRCNRARSNGPSGTVGRNSGSLGPLGGAPKGGPLPDLSWHRDIPGAPNTPGRRL